MNPDAVISAPHLHGGTSVARTMGLVMVALIPTTIWSIVVYGWPALNVLVLALVAAFVAEALCLRIGHRPLLPTLRDGSAVLTGWLLALTLPPWSPWWIPVIGSAFAIIVGKQVFGGLGQNVFNPAMVARAVLLISFPLQMTTWVEPHPFFQEGAPGFVEGLKFTFAGVPDVDAVSSATQLEQLNTSTIQHPNQDSKPGGTLSAPWTPWLGSGPGSLGEGASLLLLLGGLLLISTGVIRWPIPVAMLATVGLLASGFHIIDPQRYPDGLFHLLSGGLMLGAFFIATDPVTSPVTTAGQLVFGAGCGALTYLIRAFGGYPEGVAFAVLLMNAATSLIDLYLRPRPFGRTRRGAPLRIPSEMKSASMEAQNQGKIP
jgi:electron transport complex protein RnfD